VKGKERRKKNGCTRRDDSDAERDSFDDDDDDGSGDTNKCKTQRASFLYSACSSLSRELAHENTYKHTSLTEQ
jgi:hypothetical protein